MLAPRLENTRPMAGNIEKEGITMITKFTCTVCKQEIEHDNGSSGGTGYGFDEHDQEVCYACCAVQDTERMKKENRITLYLVKKMAGIASPIGPVHSKYGRIESARDGTISPIPGTMSTFGMLEKIGMVYSMAKIPNFCIARLLHSLFGAMVYILRSDSVGAP